MLYYNQVMGLPAAWVGAAIMVTLIFDAILRSVDWRMVGSHTLAMGPAPSVMYASAVPAAIAFYFLFDPPSGWSQSHLLMYMAAMLVAVRVLLSLYEIPSSALGPELTLDYDQRTSLMSSRFLFRNAGRRGDVGACTPGLPAARTRRIRWACCHQRATANQRWSRASRFFLDHDLMRGKRIALSRAWSMRRE